MPPRLTAIPGMAQATALTRAGKLTEATAHIQQMLGIVPAPQRAESTAVGPEVIEGEFTVLEPARAPVSGTTQPKAKWRKPLADTLRQIARGGMPDVARPPSRSSADARFTTHTYSGPDGSRDYMLYLPQTNTTDPLPVVVMLHGCTQSPQDFAAGTGMNALAAANGVIVIYPAQPTGANMNKCWNWFRPGDQQRDAGEPAILAGITRAVLADQNADPTRVYVAGLSAGGAAAAILGQAYPDLFAAVGVHSGLAVGSARDVGTAFAAMRSGAAGGKAAHAVPAIIFHGTADTTVDVANAHAVARQAQQGVTGKRVVSKGRSPQGRRFEKSALTADDGLSHSEVWMIEGAGHAWAGGQAAGSYTDPTGPDASAEMLRFFRQHKLP